MTYLEFRSYKKALMKNYDNESVENLKDLMKLINIKNAAIIPYDEPLEGRYGYMIYVPEIEEQGPRRLVLSRKIHPKAQNIIIKSKREFEDILNKALRDNLKVELHEKSAEMIIGFIVFINDKINWYNMPFRDYEREN
jgi:hypothetical protein